jgi:hypothetical protein
MCLSAGRPAPNSNMLQLQKTTCLSRHPVATCHWAASTSPASTVTHTGPISKWHAQAGPLPSQQACRARHHGCDMLGALGTQPLRLFLRRMLALNSFHTPCVHHSMHTAWLLHPGCTAALCFTGVTQDVRTEVPACYVPDYHAADDVCLADTFEYCWFNQCIAVIRRCWQVRSTSLPGPMHGYGMQAMLPRAYSTHLLCLAYWLHWAFLLLGWAACAGCWGLLILLLSLQCCYLHPETH